MTNLFCIFVFVDLEEFFLFWSIDSNAFLFMLPQTSPAPPVRIALCESDGNKSVEVGEPVVLQCQVSEPNAEVSWYKEGIELHETAKQEMLAEGPIRQLTFQSAQLSDAGLYSCKTTDDAAQFHLEVKGDESHFYPLLFKETRDL